MRANFVRGGNIYKNLDIGKYRSDTDREEIAWAEEPPIIGNDQTENKSVSLYKDKDTDLFTVETGADGGYEWAWANKVKFTYLKNAYKYFKELVDRYPEIKIYQDLTI